MRFRELPEVALIPEEWVLDVRMHQYGTEEQIDDGFSAKNILTYNVEPVLGALLPANLLPGETTVLACKFSCGRTYVVTRLA